MELRLAGENSFICILILGFILYKLYSRNDASELLLRWAIWGTILYGIGDFAWLCVNVVTDENWRWLNILITIWTFIQLPQVALCGLLYVQQRLEPLRSYPWRERLLYMLPFLVGVVLSIASVQTGWYFTIDSQNHYENGPLFWVDLCILYGYTLAAFVQTFRRAWRETDYVKKREYQSLSFFVLLPLLGGTLETILPGGLAVAPSLMLSMAFFYISRQEQQISVDMLTQLNNRCRLWSYLSERIQREDKSGLHLIMVDVDSFKRINDVYGHIVGDMALKQVASRLRRLCAGRKCFLVRYGGDEFVIVYEGSEISVLMKELKEQIAMPNGVEVVTLSSGCALYDESFRTVEEWLALADARMYVDKQSKKCR